MHAESLNIHSSLETFVGGSNTLSIQETFVGGSNTLSIQETFVEGSNTLSIQEICAWCFCTKHSSGTFVENYGIDHILALNDLH